MPIYLIPSELCTAEAIKRWLEETRTGKFKKTVGRVRIDFNPKSGGFIQALSSSEKLTEPNGNRRIYPIFGLTENNKQEFIRQGTYTMKLKMGDGSNFMNFLNQTNKKPAMNTNRNKRYEIDFESLELTEGEKSSMLTSILQERGLIVKDNSDLRTENSEEMATRFSQEIKVLPMKLQNNVASLLLDKMTDERKVKAEQAQNIANETIETYNEANKDLSDLVLRVR